MRDNVLFVGKAIVAIMVFFPSGFSQVPTTQNRIPQQIVINGQMASGAYVTAAGGQIQSFTCPAPQHYATADGSSQGWACYEQTTGVWLLNALPPAQAQVTPVPAPAPQMQIPAPPPQQPAIVYQQAPPPTVIYQPAPPPATVIYPQPATVIYSQPPPPATVIYPQPATVIYSQPPPPATVIYPQPATVIYSQPPPPATVVYAPAYPPSVVVARAAINAAGRIASAAIISSRRTREYYTYNYYDHDRDHDRGRRDRDRDHGRR